MKPAWMVRAGSGGRLAQQYKSEGFVAIGWQKIGNLQNLSRKAEFLDIVSSAYPTLRPQQIQVSASQLYRFRTKFSSGDNVVTYDSTSRTYYCGTITGEYEYHPEADTEELTNRRSVNWERDVSRDSLTTRARNTLGSTLTIFRIPDLVANELLGAKIQDGLPIHKSSEDIEDETEALPDFELLARETVKDKVAGLDWQELQELVAGLLRAMGYKTTVSPVGPDRGRDIIASPDGFGFQEPRIVVEVKHRAGQRMGAPEIRSFLGGRHSHDKGLYVSTGGFTSEARYEADRASIPLALMDSEDLIAAILDYYERFDAETKQLLPLKVVYWPITK